MKALIPLIPWLITSLFATSALAAKGELEIDLSPVPNAHQLTSKARQATRSTVETLIKHHILKIGDVDLKEFLKASETTPIHVVKQLRIKGGIGSRESAAWIENRIFISEKMLSENSESLKGILLHENAGPQGVEDNSFEFSSVVIHLEAELKKSTPEQARLLKQQAEKQFKSRQFKSNLQKGVTGVGGGGDSLLLALKLQMIRNVQAIDDGRALSQIIDLVSRLQIELSDEVAADDVHFSSNTLVLNRASLEGRSEKALSAISSQILKVLIDKWVKEGVTL